MATASLPARPNFEQLRTQARELQRGVRAGDAGALRRVGLEEAAPRFALHRAQLVVAREYGFVSWARLRHHVDAISARTWVLPDPPTDEAPADRFLRLACLSYTGEDGPAPRAEAALLVADVDRDPDIAVALVLADVGAVRRRLAENAGAATAPTGPFGWSPLMYAAYSRFATDRDALLAAVQLVLDAGADPNDGRFFLGLPMPFTVLTGVFGGGEDDQQVHPDSIPFARLLLQAGAEANDGQTLYNRMFRTDDDFLELLFEFGLGRGDGGPWRRTLPDLLPSPTELLDDLLGWAVTHDQRARVALLARNGVDVAASIELAIRNGHEELAAQLEALGAVRPRLGPVDAFVAAALAGDAVAVRATPPDVVQAARAARPALVVWATGQERLDAVELLVECGFDVNAFGRSDVPVEQKWQTALHTAVERGNARLVQRLLELGADPDLHDTRFDATPADWAGHFGRPELFGP